MKRLNVEETLPGTTAVDEVGRVKGYDGTRGIRTVHKDRWGLTNFVRSQQTATPPKVTTRRVRPRKAVPPILVDPLE